MDAFWKLLAAYSANYNKFKIQKSHDYGLLLNFLSTCDSTLSFKAPPNFKVYNMET